MKRSRGDKIREGVKELRRKDNELLLIETVKRMSRYQADAAHSALSERGLSELGSIIYDLAEK